MSTNTQRWLYRIADGLLISGGFFDVQEPEGSTPGTFGIVSVPDAVRVDVRTMRYDGNGGVRPATADEIAAYDLAQPKRIDGREVMRRLSGATQRKLGVLATQDDDVCKLWNTLRAGGDVDVHSVEFLQGAEKLKAVGIPAVWPDEAAFEAEKARLMA